MTESQAFRIYPSKESYLANSPDWEPLSGEISFEKCALISDDGKQYRLNLAKYALNNPWDDFDLNAPINKVIWFIPLDDCKWRIGLSNANQEYAFKEENQWYGHLTANTVRLLEKFRPLETKRIYRLCLKIIRCNGSEQVLKCFVWETPKYVVQQMGPQKVRFSRMTESQEQMPAAFVDDENGEEVIGFIYPSN